MYRYLPAISVATPEQWIFLPVDNQTPRRLEVTLYLTLFGYNSRAQIGLTGDRIEGGEICRLSNGSEGHGHAAICYGRQWTVGRPLLLLEHWSRQEYLGPLSVGLSYASIPAWFRFSPISKRHLSSTMCWRWRWSARRASPAHFHCIRCAQFRHFSTENLHFPPLSNFAKRTHRSWYRVVRSLLMRFAPALAALFLLFLAALRHPSPAGQGAVSHSLPGHEELTFWVNHNGLSEIDVEGEIGYGDMARLLMRRRSNAPLIQKLRDRFVFTDRDFVKLDTPDLLKPGNPPYVIAQNRVFNLLAVRNGKGYAHKIVETNPGIAKRTVAGIEAAFDVRPLARLRVRILDEEGRPTQARVYLTAADGLAYTPKGSIARYAALPAEPFFHSSGFFEIDLPAGETTIEATRGIEYDLAAETATLIPDRPAEVTLRLRRWTGMASRGWFSSDAHIHANYTAAHHQLITRDDVRLYTLAEDLHYANMMVANSFGAFLHDTEFFRGKPDPLSRGNHLIYWNEEMRNAGVYGHMCFYQLKRLVEPLYTGFRDTPQWEDYPPNFTQAKAAREQGGAVTYAHPGYAASFDGASARELPVDLALGEVDAMDVLSNNPEEVALMIWYRLLNCGFRLGVSAGTDSFTNVADHYTPGGGRVYARLGGSRMKDKDWIKAYKRGRTFATNGPMLFLDVEGRGPGDEIRLPRGPQKLRVKVTHQSRVPLDRVELVVNGRAFPAADATLTIDRSSWIAARASGPRHRLVLNDTATFAHTSPIYVTMANQPIRSPEDARFFTDWIDRLIQRVHQRGQFSTPARKQEVVELFTRAREIYQTRIGQ